MRILAVLLFLTGCGGISRACTHWTGELTYKCNKEGVEYVQSDSGIARSDHRDGTPAHCGP